jgi:hypothetical protein
MIPLLLLTRAAIIGWTTLAVFPLEIAFDLIEGELERLGVREYPAELGAQRVGLSTISSSGDI